MYNLRYLPFKAHIIDPLRGLCVSVHYWTWPLFSSKCRNWKYCDLLINVDGVLERPHANYCTVLPAGCWKCVTENQTLSALKLPCAAVKCYSRIEGTLFIFGWWMPVPHRYFGQFPPPSFEGRAGSSWTLMDHIKSHSSPGGFSSSLPTTDRAALSLLYFHYWSVLIGCCYSMWQYLTFYALFPPFLFISAKTRKLSYISLR